MLSVHRVALRRCVGIASLPSTSKAISFVPVRAISSNDVFNYSQSVGNLNIPAAPMPPPPAPSLQELVDAGESVLGELGLLSWWKPSSYFRVALESIHTMCDIPWWTTIVAATVALRMALIIVPVMSQRLVAKQSHYKKELDGFRSRLDDARAEGNNMLMQQILMEQRDFLKSKDIRMGRQFFILLANGCVFMTQFFAVKQMTNVGYPGLSTGGTAWFTDLTMSDPYYALPLISAVTMHLVSRVGIEMGASPDQMPPAMRLGMMYGLPVVIFVASSQFASGICVYWCASNMMSLLYAGLFKVPTVRKLFNIPAMVKHAPAPNQLGPIKKLMENYKANSAKPPSMSQLKEADSQRFKKAGRGKPIVK